MLKSAIDSEPDNAEALFLLSNAQLQNGHYDDAIASARKVHGTAHQGFEGAHVVCVMALAAENRNSEAADDYCAFLKEASGSKKGRSRLRVIPVTVRLCKVVHDSVQRHRRQFPHGSPNG